MGLTEYSNRTEPARPHRLVVAVLLLLASLAVAAPPGAAATDQPAPIDVFEERCEVDGAVRTVPLGFSVGGKIGKLVTNSGGFVELDEPLPAGSYRASYVSYDGYSGRERINQAAEVWEVVFLSERTEQGILGTIGPTADLADNVAAAYAFDWPIGAVTTITTAVDTNHLSIRHAASTNQGRINSVQPICLVLFEADDGTDPSGGQEDTCDAATVIHRNPDATFGSSTGKLWNRSSSRVLTRFDPPLTEGTYRVVGGSYDGYIGRAKATWERAETWVAEFWSADGRLLAVSDPSQDLADGAGNEEASWEGPMGRVELRAPAERVIVRHTNPDGKAPNSVHVSCLGISPDDGSVPGLADARPASDVPWSAVGPDWLLTVVQGEVMGGEQPQGLYLVAPDGNRWVVHSSVRSPQVEGLGRILDWDVFEREALVLILGPRDLHHIARFDLESGEERQLTSRIGGDFVPNASYLPSNAGVLLVLDYADGARQQLEFWSAEGVELSTVGPTLPIGIRYDWIESPNSPDFVIADGFAVGGARGRVMYYPGPLFEERPMAREDCIPVRWVVGGLAAACDSVAGQSGRDLWVVPTDGSDIWPVVHPEVTSTLGVSGFSDIYESDGTLFLESNAGEVWTLEEGCDVPTRLQLPGAPGRIDMVAAVDGDVIAHAPFAGQLLRLNPNAADAQLLLDGVIDTARSDADRRIGTATLPAPPSPPDPSVPDTCEKSGEGQFALLTDVRWAHHDGFTRVVFDFQDDAPSVPGWTMDYIPGPILSENPGGPTIEGDGLLSVIFNPSSRADLSDPDNIVLTYDGPTEIDVGAGSVVRINLVEDFEAYLEWVIEVDGRKPFSAFALSSPPRVVIDIEDQ